MDWSKYPNFTRREFDCQHSGRNEMREHFMDSLQALRAEYGKAMIVTSGYRDPSHPIEARKASPGTHAHGIAVDIGVHSNEAYKLVELAFKHGFTGIGVSQKSGGARFIHLDKRTTTPVLYSYR